MHLISAFVCHPIVYQEILFVFRFNVMCILACRIASEAERSYGGDIIDIDDGLEALLFETPRTEDVQVPPPTYTAPQRLTKKNESFIPDEQQALQAHLLDLEASLSISRAPSVPSTEPKPKHPGSGASPLAVGL